MSSETAGVNWLEVLLLLLSSSGLAGMPPGERDPHLAAAVPENSLVYVEWVSRSAEDSGRLGFEGLMAEPEVRKFLQAIHGTLTDKPTPEVSDEDEGGNLNWTLVNQIVQSSGCLMVGLDGANPPNLFGNVPALLEMVGRIRIGLVLNARDRVEPLLEELAKSLGSPLGANPQFQEANLPGSGWKIPGLSQVVVHREGNYVILGVGKGTVQRLVAGLKREQPGLDRNARFVQAERRFSVGKPGNLVWIDSRETIDAVTKTAGAGGVVVRMVLNGLGLGSLDSIFSTTGLENGNVIQRTFLATDGKTEGVFALAGGPALKSSQLEHVPADTAFVLAGNVSVPYLIRSVRDLIGKTAPVSLPVFDEAVKQLESELELSLERDLYPALGETITAFGSSGLGGLSGSGPIIALELREKARAEKVVQRLATLIERALSGGDSEEFGRRVEFRKQVYLETTIYYVVTLGEGFGADLAMFTPAFCVTPTHLLMAPHPQAIKSHLRLPADRRSKLDVNALQRSLMVEGELLAMTRMDGVRTAQVLSAVAPFMAPKALHRFQPASVPLDPFLVPSSEALVPHARDATLMVSRQKDGILIDIRNQHYPLALLAILGGAQGWFSSMEDFSLASREGLGEAIPVVGDGKKGAVVPAVAEKPVENAAAAAARRIAPLIIKALIPDDIQGVIPNELIDKIGQPPSEETLKKRAERRQMLEDRRRQRQQKRLAP